MISTERKRRGRRDAIALAAALAVGCVLTAIPVGAAETAVAPEKNPPGDIPDNQIFVTYKGPQGFSLKVPEGWARRDAANGVSFTNKYGEIAVTVAAAAAAPTIEEVKAGEIADLVRTGHAVAVASTTNATLKAGPAVKVAYSSNSEPNAVTGKRIRLENERFVIGGPARRAMLTLSAPAGADNADQWKLIAESFRWN